MKVAQLCPILCNPMNYTVHGILQARMLEWVAFPFSRESSQPRDRTQVSHIAGGFLTSWATRETLEIPQNQVLFHTPSHLPLQCPLYSRFRASLGHAGPSFPQGLVLDPSTQKSFCLHYSEICPSPEGGGPSSRLHYLMITATQSKTELHGHTRYSKQQFYL